MNAHENPPRWLVLFQPDAEPVEVYPFAEAQRDDAEALYARLSLGWSEVYLVDVLRAPGLRRADVCGLPGHVSVPRCETCADVAKAIARVRRDGLG